MRSSDRSLRVNLAADGRVLNVLGAPARALDVATTPSLSAGEAVRAVQDDVGVHRPLVRRGGTARDVDFGNDTSARLVTFSGRLAWRVRYRAGDDAVYRRDRRRSHRRRAAAGEHGQVRGARAGLGALPGLGARGRGGRGRPRGPRVSARGREHAGRAVRAGLQRPRRRRRRRRGRGGRARVLVPARPRLAGATPSACAPGPARARPGWRIASRTPSRPSTSPTASAITSRRSASTASRAPTAWS